MRNGRFYGGFNNRDLIFFLGVGLVALLRKRVFSFFLISRFIKKCWDPFFRNQRAIPYPKNQVSRDSVSSCAKSEVLRKDIVAKYAPSTMPP